MIARGHGVILDHEAADEIRYRVKPEGQAVASKVTLWPGDGTDDGDAFCDCAEKADPCSHIAACVAAAKSGFTQSASDTSKTSSRLIYQLERNQGELLFDRIIENTRGQSPLLGSLVSYVAGTGSGRIAEIPLAATQADFGVDQALGPGGARGRLDRKTWERLLLALRTIDSVVLDGVPVRTGLPSRGLEAELIDESGGFRLRLTQDGHLPELFRPGLMLAQGILRLLEDPGLTVDERRSLESPGRRFDARETPQLVSEILPALERKIPVHIRTKNLPVADSTPPRVVLETHQETTADGERLRIIAKTEYVSEFSRRDLRQEEDLARRLRLELQLTPGQVAHFEGDEALRMAERISAVNTGWVVRGSGVDAFKVRGGLRIAAATAPSAPFEFRPTGTNVLGIVVSAEAVLSAWRAGHGRVPLRQNAELIGWAELPLTWLKDFGARAEEVFTAWSASRKPGIKPPAWAQLDATELLEDAGAEITFDLRSIKERILAATPSQSGPRPELRAELRDYQKDGIAWLERLRDLGLGAILADDMGLGKTLQAIAVCQAPALVVCPTSVLRSWRDQLERFRPGLPVSIYHGSERALPRPEHRGVVLTSYAILRMDSALLTDIPWKTLILDESQTIRNPDSQVARAAHVLASAKPQAFRVALTGTPIENRLEDLWSQVQFSNPGFLGVLEDFKELLRGDEAETVTRLKRRLKLILLRRRKIDVAKELPPRTESRLDCELSDSERDLYGALLSAGRARVLDEINSGASTLSALELLLRLRQAACHPGLVPGQSADSSSKLELIVDALASAIAEGRKTLVFSQWTSFLDLIGRRLDTEGIRWDRLDGSTRDRGEVVERFQSDQGAPVLLLSLKAGGVGLTLTAADHILLCDPWWNPATEDQAADRAHRIGQTRPVLIRKLVALGTVEEKLLGLQSRKRELAALLLGDGDEGSSVSGVSGLSLTREDLLELLGA